MTPAHGSRLRIAYLVGAFPDISETFVVNQINGVAARGHAVDIYTTWHRAIESHTPSQETTDKFRIETFVPISRGWGLLELFALVLVAGWRAPLALLRLVKIAWRHRFGGAFRLFYATLTLLHLNRREYDVIHAQFGPLGVLAAQLIEAGVWRGQLVTSFRGYDVGKHLLAHPGAYRDLFRCGTLFLPVSETLASSLIKAGCPPRRTHVLHSGIDRRQLPYRERCEKTACAQIITVARLVEKKGIRYALQAIARVAATGRPVFYVVIGDGPLRASLEREASQLGVASLVRFEGAQPHAAVLAAIDRAHILLAPSVTSSDGDEEGIPNSLKEAMALGLPVIGTRHGGIPELIEDGVSGFLVPERDADAIAERLIPLIDSPERWPTMGAAGRQRIETSFDIDRLTDELLDRYRHAVSQTKTTVTLTAVAPAVRETGRV